MTTDDVEKLNDLLVRMWEADKDFRVFGASNHQYCLERPLSESELQAFERQHSVMLPADFRFFLREAGNGGAMRSWPYTGIISGAGPSNGVMPLEAAVLECDLGKPFPLTAAVEVQPFPGVERWGDEEGYPGVLQICYHGCSGFSFLVINGPAYGTIWSADVDIQNYKPTYPSFDSWYGEWMSQLEEHALPRLANERRIAEVRVGMTKAEVIALAGGRWEQKPSWEGKAHLSFKHLSTAFELNEEDVVVRIIAHSISCG